MGLYVILKQSYMLKKRVTGHGNQILEIRVGSSGFEMNFMKNVLLHDTVDFISSNFILYTII